MSLPEDKRRNALFNRISHSKHRRLELMQKGHLCDCEFVVGKGTSQVNQASYNDVGMRSFKCHKMVLATASEVFERMFYGEVFVERLEQPIRLDDVTPEIFEILLAYIYTYEFNATCLTVQRCCQIFYVGYKYMMDDFIESCVSALKEKTWMMEDVLPLYELACFYSNLSLMLLSYQKIHQFAIQLLNHQTFFKLNVYNLKRLMVLLSKVIDGNRLLLVLERYDSVNNLRGAKDKTEYKELLNAAHHISFKSSSPFSYLLTDS